MPSRHAPKTPSKVSVALLTLAGALQGLAQSFIPVTGVPVNQPAQFGVPIRLNINDLQAQGGPQWALYNLALLSMQRDSDDSPLSYFQISGIHGFPFTEWNGAGPGVGGSWGGYCPHNENLFLPWHRAYIALFEQVLVERARQIAATYPEQVRYQYLQAAETLRSPYWDWAADHRVPPATVPPTVWVTGNDLRQVEIENPLSTYRLPWAVLNGRYGPYDAQMRPQTMRCRAPNSYPQSANNLLSSRPLRQWVYDALTRASSFTEFSLGGGLVSLEQAHNQIHLDAACGEQFYEFSLTAFDPLFMLHHTNVDRLWAFWQVLRPDQDIFTQPYVGLARFATRAGTVITQDSPLEPFFDRRRRFHTPMSARALWDFGYSYRGVEWWRRNEAQMRQDVTGIINRLYGPGNRPGGWDQRRRRAGPTTRYFARLQVDVAQLERPCRLSLFVNGTQAGNLVVMARPQSGVVRTGFGLDVVAPGEELRSMLDAGPSVEIEILRLDGSRIPLGPVTSLAVEVEAVEVTLPSTLEELPRYGESRRYNATVTERRH